MVVVGAFLAGIPDELLVLRLLAIRPTVLHPYALRPSALPPCTCAFSLHTAKLPLRAKVPLCVKIVVQPPPVSRALPSPPSPSSLLPRLHPCPPFPTAPSPLLPASSLQMPPCLSPAGVSSPRLTVEGPIAPGGVSLKLGGDAAPLVGLLGEVPILSSTRLKPVPSCAGDGVHRRGSLPQDRSTLTRGSFLFEAPLAATWQRLSACDLPQPELWEGLPDLLTPRAWMP